MKARVLKPWTVVMSRGMITISVATIMATDETSAIDRGLLILKQENDLPSMAGWEAKALHND